MNEGRVPQRLLGYPGVQCHIFRVACCYWWWLCVGGCGGLQFCGESSMPVPLLKNAVFQPTLPVLTHSHSHSVVPTP